MKNVWERIATRIKCGNADPTCSRATTALIILTKQQQFIVLEKQQ